MPRTSTARTSIASTPEIRAKALVVHERLCAAYGCPIAYFHELDPLSELVSSLLSHRTKNGDSGRAFKQLRRRFATWAEVCDAPTSDVEEAIAPVTWPEQKAPRIQAILREIAARRGALDEHTLDFLAEVPVPDARAWLESLGGVGPKTSAAVLLFSRLRRPALPVDSHHHRVAQRLGLIGPNVAVGPSHAVLEAQLPPDWDAQQVYDNHEALMLHGQRCCFHANPACHRCVVLDLCPTGQARLATPARPADGRGRTTPERPLPPVGASRGDAAPDDRPDDRTETRPAAARAAGAIEMSVHPHPDRGPQPERGDHAPDQGSRMSDADRERLRGVHADPEQLDREAAEQRAQRSSPGPVGDLNDPQHARQGSDDRAHGTHGKGFMDERLADEVATDTGDDAQLRRAGGGGNQPPSPEAFRDPHKTAGHMGGAGWGSEQVGGSVVDRRPPDPDSGDERRHA